jgi:hypothetical protein
LVAVVLALCYKKFDRSGQERSVEEDMAMAWLDYQQTMGEICRLLREIFGNPFRPVILDPRWLTSAVVDSATAIYNHRAFDRMPILGGALLDAGCDNEEIIAHCRSEATHVRGCWVVDLILAKA